MKAGEIYKCKIKLRKTFKGDGLKPEVIALNGKALLLQVLWKFDEGDLYENEYAMDTPYNAPVELFELAKITWIASGDVELFELCDRNTL